MWPQSQEDEGKAVSKGHPGSSSIREGGEEDSNTHSTPHQVLPRVSEVPPAHHLTRKQVEEEVVVVVEEEEGAAKETSKGAPHEVGVGAALVLVGVVVVMA